MFEVRQAPGYTLYNLQTYQVFCFKDLVVTSELPSSLSPPPAAPTVDSFSFLQTLCYFAGFTASCLCITFNILLCFGSCLNAFCKKSVGVDGNNNSTVAVSYRKAYTALQRIGLFSVLLNWIVRPVIEAVN